MRSMEPLAPRHVRTNFEIAKTAGSYGPGPHGSQKPKQSLMPHKYLLDRICLEFVFCRFLGCSCCFSAEEGSCKFLNQRKSFHFVDGRFANNLCPLAKSNRSY